MSIRRRVLTPDWSLITQWATDTLGLASATAQVRLRGNHLYILCTASECPSEKQSVARFSQALHQTHLQSFLPQESPPIYQIFLSGRSQGAKRPHWTVKLNYDETLIDLKESPEGTKAHLRDHSKGLLQTITSGLFKERTSTLESTQSQKNTATLPEQVAVDRESEPESFVEQPILSVPSPSTSTVEPESRPESLPALEIQPQEQQQSPTPATEVLARQGHPAAIASHLSEILGSLGVSVKVRRKDIPPRRRVTDSPDLPHPKPVTKQRLWILCESAYSPDPSLLAEPIAQKLRELELANCRDACIVLQVQGEPKPDWMLRVDLTPPEKILKQWARWGDEAAIAHLLNLKLSTRGLKVRTTLKESTLHLFCQTQKKQQTLTIPDQSVVMEVICPILERIKPQGIQAATVYGVDPDQTLNEADTPLWIDWLNLPAATDPALQPSTFTLGTQGNLDALKFLMNRLINPDLDVKLATGGIRVLLLRKGNILHVMTEGSTCPSQSQVAPPIARFLRTASIQDLTGVRIYGRRSGQKSPLWRYGFSLKSTTPEAVEPQMEFAPPTTDTDELAVAANGLVLRPNLGSIQLETGEFSQTPSQSRPWQAILAQWSDSLQQALMATGLLTTPEPMLVNRSASETHRSQKVSFALVWAALGCLLVVQTDLILAKLLREQQGIFSSENMSAVNLGGLITYPTFASQQLDEQLALYQSYVARMQQPPDILIIGSSRALRGVDPSRLEAALQEQGHGKLKVFNFGVNGATLQVVDLIIRRVLPPEQLPRLILIADGVRAVNGGRVDRTYDSIAASEGYQQIADGTLQIGTEETKSAELSPTEPEAGLLGWLQPNGASGSILDRWQRQLEQQIQTLSGSYLYRDRFKQGLQAMMNQQTIIPPQPTPDASAAEPTDILEQNIPALQDNGFLPMSIKFNPATYYQNHSRVSGYYDGDYQGFDLEGLQTTALQNLLQYVQDRSIDVAFVNMPLTQDYLDPVRRQYEQMFREYMQQLDNQTPLKFVDLGLAFQQQYDYFSDPSHLNRYGAVAVSERLATESQIPWQR